MTASTMFISSGLLLVLLVFVPSSTANTLAFADISMKLDEPLSILHGEYHLKDHDHFGYRPSWASVWKVSNDDVASGEFFISFWPPKYCHAVYVCPVKQENYNDVTTFKTGAATCEGRYIKYYPHINKVLLKEEGGNEESRILMSNRLEFEIDENYMAQLKVLSAQPENFGKWEEAAKLGEKLPINLNDMNLLILTNSRMCQVNKPGSKFYPFFKTAIQNDQSGLFPKWFDTADQTISTDFLPPNQAIGKGKTMDLLAYIKDLEWSNGKIGNLVKTCEGEQGSGGRNVKPKGQFTKVSVHSYKVAVNQATYVGRSVKQFTLNVPSCHWFRIWVSTDDDMKDYKTKMDLSNTIDVFLKEGFYVTPESNIANPLPSITELSVFTFRAQRLDNNGINLVEMSFGDVQGQRIYFEHFNLPVMQKKNFKLHVIKAPRCEVSMDQALNEFTDYNAERMNSMWRVDQCSYSFFK